MRRVHRLLASCALVAALVAEAHATDAGTHKRPTGAKLRTIHPRSPDDSDCVEMVSMCTGKPRRCTSSPLHVACGEELEVKSQKEWLRCDCAKHASDTF